MIRGFVDIVRAGLTALLHRFARLLVLPALGVLWLADRCEPGGRTTSGRLPPEWNPRLWDRTGGRTANEPRL